jgi:hypothetical protein
MRLDDNCGILRIDFRFVAGYPVVTHVARLDVLWFNTAFLRPIPVSATSPILKPPF